MTENRRPASSGSIELARLAVADAARRVRRDLDRDAPPRARNLPVLALAVALFIGIFALRVAVEDPNTLIASFYTVPVALLAVVYGVRSGLLGALVAAFLVWLWNVTQAIELDALGYVSRTLAALLVGGLVGWYSERLRVDIVRRKEAERELGLQADELARSNRRLEQAVGRLSALATIARAVGGETDMRRSLERIADLGRDLTGAAFLAVDVREGGELMRVAAVGDPAGRRAGEQRYPLGYRGEDLGTLSVATAPGERPPDQELVLAIAASAAAAIATARSVAADRVREAISASERERRRWAWELHDQTLQGLVGLRVSLSAALRAGDPGALERAVMHALEDIRIETSNLQHLIAELRPASLDELGLGPALTNLCEQVEATAGIEVSRTIELDGAAPAPDVETSIYRVVQEALTNVVKHSGAERASVGVRAAGGAIAVEVTDDGRGFDPRARPSGLGLRGMRERVELAGGELDISASVKGTRVRATLPSSPAPPPSGAQLSASSAPR